MRQATKRYRAAIVGCGRIGALFERERAHDKPASHAGAVRANDATELVALVDTNPKTLAAARKLFPGAAGYRSLADCLKQRRPDIVIIATPPAARLSLLKACVRARVPMVVCEKPLAMSANEAKRTEALAATNGLTFVLNYQRRFSPLFARVRARIKSGKLGRIQQVTCYYSNGLYNNGGHVVDALAYLLDDHIVSAAASRNATNTTHPVGDVNVDALLTTKGGTTVVLQSFDQKEYGIHDIRLYGTKGSVVLTDYGTTLVETPARPSRFAGIRQLDRTRHRTTRMPLSATKDALAHVIECYERRRKPVSSVGSGLLTLRVLDAVARSAKREGRTVAV